MTTEQQLWTLHNSSEPSAVTNHETAGKVDRNDLAEIHQQYVTVLSTLNERKRSLNNAYRLIGTARCMIRDFLGIAELRIVNKVKAPWKGWKRQNLQLKGSSRGAEGSWVISCFW